MTGIIIKAVGGLYTVEASEGIYECAARGIFRKRGISPMCGDNVIFDENEKLITDILERKSELIRPPLANLDLMLFIASVVQPQPDTLLLDKFIAVCEYKRIDPAVVITKTDLGDCGYIKQIYEKAGIPVFCVDNTTGEGSAKVLDYVSGKLCAFTGNSGVGKSSLLNNMFPQLKLNTAQISRKLGRGKHTTRTVELYKLPGGGYIADTPGFSTFETNRYDIIFKDKLAGCFREFAEYESDCRFRDCSHTTELGCAVIEAVKAGRIAPSRHESYVAMYSDAAQINEWEHK